MNDQGHLRFTVIALALATIAACVFGVLSMRQQWVYRLPTDGVQWQQSAGGVRALSVGPEAPQSAFSVQPGDLLRGINGHEVHDVADVAKSLFQTGIGGRLDYQLERNEVPLLIAVRVRASQPPLYRYSYQEFVGFLYLLMGIYILIRRQAARKSVHFYLFCLTSFVLYTFHFTGKLNLFDWIIFWGNETALLLTPALFLHFALNFPEPKGVRRRIPALTGLVYVPSALLLMAQIAVATGALRTDLSMTLLQGLLDRTAYALLAICFLAAALEFHRTAKRTSDRVLVQQLNWMTQGTMLAIVPFVFFYIGPYLLGMDLPNWTGLSVISLIFIPLAFGYAIVRYRLMDVEIMVRRGVVYTLATAAVVGIYFAVIGGAALLVQTRLPHSGSMGWLLAIVVTALLFDPVKNWIQERLDRLFYRERYDYRRTLIEFARQMNAEPELHHLVELVIERLSRTLFVDRIAVFLNAGSESAVPAETGMSGDRFALLRARGMSPEVDAKAVDLSFLGMLRHTPMFIEKPANAIHLPEEIREPVATLGMHYYLPCEFKQRTVAVIGLGKTHAGDLLSSEDVALLETLAGYLAVALENARLYTSLQHKANEYERLKDFNENIVESIRVGVVALDLEGRVESWNSQMEVLSGETRSSALGRAVAEVLGPDLAREFELARKEGGIRNLYKFRLAVGGRDKTVNLAIAPLVTRFFQRIGHIVLIDDITTEVELEQRLAQTDRLSSVGLLAAGVAHEVNTPLAVISSYTQLLSKQIDQNDPKAKVLEKITQQTFRASEIIGNLLNFSRTGGTEFRELDINTVVKDTLALVEHPLRTARVVPVAVLSPDLPGMQGNPGKLQQVFLNLILNARDAMPEGGTLQVRSRAQGDSIIVEFMDSGEGIPSDLHHRIFDPFFTTKQADRSSGTMSSGTGLGLAVTYGIVQEHGGAIAVESEPQRGTCFRLEFPALRKVVHA